MINRFRTEVYQSFAQRGDAGPRKCDVKQLSLKL